MDIVLTKKEFRKRDIPQELLKFFQFKRKNRFILRNKIRWIKQILIKKENRTIGSVMPTCLSPETEVYIKDEVGIVSPKKLKELLGLNLKNLRILSPTGWKRIKDIWQVEHNRVIKFQIGSSSEIECSLSHKFPISHDNRRKRYEIKEAQALRIGKNKMLDRFLFVPISDFLEGKNELGGQVLTYRLGKFIGLYVAEGGFVDYSKFKSYQGKFTLNKIEDELTKDIVWGLRLFGIPFKITKIKNCQTIVFSSKKIKEFISRFVLGKCKEKKLDMVSVLNTNKEFRQGIFDGIIAGDGHKDKNGRIIYGTASKQLRDDVYLLASSIGLLASKYKPNNKRDKRTGKIYTGYFLTIPPSLQKEKLTNEFKAKTLKFSNPQISKEIRWLIDVEVEDGLFLINGGIVSHNSVKDRFNESGEELYFFTKNTETLYWRHKYTRKVVWKKPKGIQGIENEDWEWKKCLRLKEENGSPCKKCQGTGRKKMSLWLGYDYWCDLDAVRLPNQVLGVTDMRASGFVRTRELYPNSKYRKEDYMPMNKQSNARKTLKARMSDTKNKDQKSSRTYNIKKLLSEVRLGVKPNTGIMPRKIDQTAEFFRQKGQRGNTNLPWRPKLTEQEIDKLTGRPIDKKHKGIWRLTGFEREKLGVGPNKVNDPRGNHEGGPGSWRDELNSLERLNNPLGKNLPTAWLIGAEPHNFQKELGSEITQDHFAVFPEALCDIPIRFGCPKKICKNCRYVIE